MIYGKWIVSLFCLYRLPALTALLSFNLFFYVPHAAAIEDNSLSSSSKKTQAVDEFRPSQAKSPSLGFRPAAIMTAQARAAQLKTQDIASSAHAYQNSAPNSTSKLPSTALPFKGTPKDLEGRYGLLRQGMKDTGCLITLGMKNNKELAGQAQLAPACRDEGLVLFDPISWRIDHSKLILRARLGHETAFYQKSTDLWSKLDEKGLELFIRKL
jgi:hypothetical protein